MSWIHFNSISYLLLFSSFSGWSNRLSSYARRFTFDRCVLCWFGRNKTLLNSIPANHSQLFQNHYSRLICVICWMKSWARTYANSRIQLQLMSLKLEQRDINLRSEALRRRLTPDMMQWNCLEFVICTSLMRGGSQNRAVWNCRTLRGILTNPTSNYCQGSFAWHVLKKIWCWAI